MTQMPQMVALYNGVGGGAVALIAWSEIRHGISLGEEFPLEELIPILFCAVVGSVSFWGSNIAFAKLQDLIPTKPLAVPGQQVINAMLLRRNPRGLHLHLRSTTTTSPRASSSGSCSPRRCSETWSCCRSAAPTCRSSSPC